MAPERWPSAGHSAAWNVLPGATLAALVGMAGEDHRHGRPVVEERRRLLPGRRDLHGLGRRRLRRLRRARPADRPPRRPRRHLPLADALLSDRRPRRRLRHHRLLRRRPAAGHPRRLRRGRPDGEGPRHAGDRRPRRQPHLDQAPLVPGGRASASTRRSATSTSGAPTRRRTPRRRSSSPTRSRASGRCRRRRGSGTCTASTRSSPTSTSPNPRVRDELAKVMGFWLQLGLDGFRVDAVPFLLETDGVDAQEAAPFPDPHEYLRALRSLVGRRSEAGDPARRGEPALRAAAGVLRRPRRRRADHAVRLHHHAAALPVPGPRATPDRWSRR